MKGKKQRPAVYLTRPKPQEQGKYFAEKERLLEERNAILIEKERDLRASYNLLDDTIHEMRKINNQIKGNIHDLSKEIEETEFHDSYSLKYINDILKTLDANASLLSIRMDAYDFLSNPLTANRELEVDLGVYAKVEKVYKCLYPSRKEKEIEIELKGKSENKYRLRNSIELAFFIIIENAIKYSPQGETVTISFYETAKKTIVEFQNWAICPYEEEMGLLTERGFRSKRIQDNPLYNGSGLGLYLLKQICQLNHVELAVGTEPDSRTISGKEYNPFVVTLTFSY